MTKQRCTRNKYLLTNLCVTIYLIIMPWGVKKENKQAVNKSGLYLELVLKVLLWQVCELFQNAGAIEASQSLS